MTKNEQNLTNQDLQALGDLMGGLLDKQNAVLASKEDLKDLKVELKDYIHEGIETVMEGIDGLAEKLAEKEKVERLIEWAREAGDKIGVKPKI